MTSVCQQLHSLHSNYISLFVISSCLLSVLLLLLAAVGEMSMGRQEAFEIFRRDYHSNHKIEENKRILKQRYSEAKGLGEQVNASRTKISEFLALLTC